jgi:hypothetical protein
MKRKISFGIILLLTITVLAFAEVDLRATGYNWLSYSKSDKQALVVLMYDALKINEKARVENGVNILNGFYDQLEKKYANDSTEKDKYLRTPCMNILVSIIKQSAKK